MAEIDIGNKFNFLRHVVQLQSIGRVTVLIGRGVCVGIGTASRGPAMEPFFCMGSQPSLIRATYYAGPLKEGMETAADQGCSVVGGVRVLGVGYASALLELDDSQVSGNHVATLNATGPGAWGQIPRFKIEYGDLDGRKTEIFTGNGGTTPYALLYDDLVEATTNYVKVNGVALAKVYTGTPDPGEAKFDTVKGEVSFASGEWPTEADQVEVRYSYKSRKITVYDENSQPVVYNNLMSLTMAQAQMLNSPIATFDPVVGATHLPERTLVDGSVVAVNMAGGLDGAEPTIDDWELAFNNLYEQLPDQIIPTAVYTTQNEVTAGQKDIVPLMDAFLRKMANGRGATGKMPCQGFVSLVDSGQTIMTAQEMADFAEGYNNLWMTLIGNGLSQTERNLAAARAGQEATLPLGTSPATDSNSFKGVDGLLFQFTEVQREVFTYGQVEVLVKETGIHPYVGISTDPDDSFKRTVDVRTINQCIIWIDQIVAKFLNERRTLTNLGRMQDSIYVLLDQLRNQSVLDDFNVKVTPNMSDHNAVDISCMIQPVGHIERVLTWMGVGYYSDRVAA